jgi:S1-C subfamily serine protease
MNKNTYKKYLTGAAMLLLFVFASFAPSARASFWDNLWKGITSPFAGNSSSTTTQTIPIPLYRPTLDYENAVVAAVKKSAPAVVAITISKNVPVIEQCPGASPFSDLPPEFQQFFGGNDFSVPCDTGKKKLQDVGGGSGFIISSDGLILTNKHVASDKTASYTVFTNDGKKYPATILAQDPVQDLAVLKINATGLPTVALGDSDSLELGQTSIAIGNALGEFRNTVSVGVISGLARTITASGAGAAAETLAGVIQTDAAINPGNSGGPLLNLRGEVIGINTAVANNAQGIGFAIPINRAKRDIKSVKASGQIQAAYLGIRNMTITAEMAKSQSLQVDHGALVRGGQDGPAVAKGSPADKGGIQAEDIILEVNGKKIDENNSLSSLISEYNPGDAITLKINRGGKEITITVTLGKRPK